MFKKVKVWFQGKKRRIALILIIASELAPLYPPAIPFTTIVKIVGYAFAGLDVSEIIGKIIKEKKNAINNR